MGPRCAELEVRDPAQYHFNPDALLLSMVTFMARLAEQPAFVRAVSAVRAAGRGAAGAAAANRRLLWGLGLSRAAWNGQRLQPGAELCALV